MPDLFGLDLAGIVADAIDQAGGLLDATLTKKTPGTRNPSDLTAGTNPTSTSYSCKGVVSDYSTRLIDGTLVATGDRRVLILGATLPSGIVPSTGDQVAIESLAYDVVRVTRDPAAASYELQVRGAR
jgi:hypothetical protein